jgi:signal transduction histidine kinase/ActR/RegA family two-component response regulator
MPDFRRRLQSIDLKLPLLASSLVVLTALVLATTAHLLLQRVLVEGAGRRLHESARIVAQMVTRPSPTVDALGAATDSALRAFARGAIDRAAAIAALGAMASPSDTLRVYGAFLDTAGRPVLEFHRHPGRPASRWPSEAVARGEISDSISTGPVENLGGIAVLARVHALRERNDSGARVIGYVADARAISGRNAARFREIIGRDVELLLGQPGTPVWTDLERPVPAPRIGGRRDSVVVTGDVVGALAPVVGTNMRVWLAQPKRVVLGPLTTFLLTIIPVGLGIALVGAAIVWRFTRSITRPIAQLTEAAENIAKDSGDSQMHPTVLMPITQDEVARLRYAFERMARRVAERQTLELELRHAQKMEAVGRLAGGVAHDFNNLLTAIRSYADLLLADTPEWDQKRDDLLEIRRASERAAALTSQLLAFSRKQMLQPRVVDTREVLIDLRAMLQRILAEDSQLVMDVSGDVWPVKVDRGQLEQVIVNLTVNARDAMPNGGAIRVSALNETLEHPVATRHGPIPVGQYVAISVTDTGIGMDARTQNQAFEPFFTTKPMGQGTGLGLATVHGIVAQSGGHVRLQSEVGKGTTFTVFLPRVKDKPRVSRPGLPAMPAARQRGSETILLVEDEQSVRSLAKRVLERSGFRVLEASSPTSALTMAEQYRRDIDLVVSDVVMPEMSGPVMVEKLAEILPVSRVLFISGYTNDEILGRGLAEPGAMLLPKPFSAQELVERVRQALDQEPATASAAED